MINTVLCSSVPKKSKRTNKRAKMRSGTCDAADDAAQISARSVFHPITCEIAHVLPTSNKNRPKGTTYKVTIFKRSSNSTLAL